MEIEVAVTVLAVAKVVIGEDGEPTVVGVEIGECIITPPSGNGN